LLYLSISISTRSGISDPFAPESKHLLNV
jgi:hypothetical protein